MGKRLALIGAGAMGGQAGAKLTAAGEDIVLIDPWEANVEAMRQRGITIQYRDQVIHCPKVRVLHSSEVHHLREPIDILFVFVKSFDTEWAVNLVLPYLSADSWVVSLQNCINEYIIEPLVGAHHVLGGVLMANGQMFEPGMITSYSPDSSEADFQQLALTVGELMGPATHRAREVAKLLDSTWPATTTDNLLEERWNKMVVNCMGNALCGITGLTTREGLQHPECRRLMIQLGAESIRVIWALGFTVHTIYLGNFTAEECIATAEGQSDAADRGLASGWRRSTQRPGDP